MIGTSLIALTEKARALVESEEVQLHYRWNGDITVMAYNLEKDTIVKKTVYRQPFVKWCYFNDAVNAVICRLAA